MVRGQSTRYTLRSMISFGADILTAIATAVLAVFAVVTAWYARKALCKQSEEVHDQAELLKLQAEEFRHLATERDREWQERRRAQAVQVYVWQKWSTKMAANAPPQNMVTVQVRNASQQPIHDVTFVTLVDDVAQKWSRRVPPLMPESDNNTDETTFPVIRQRHGTS
jgi:hypothetical protein